MLYIIKNNCLNYRTDAQNLSAIYTDLKGTSSTGSQRNYTAQNSAFASSRHCKCYQAVQKSKFSQAHRRAGSFCS